MDESSKSRNTVGKKDDCRGKSRVFMSIIGFLLSLVNFNFEFGVIEDDRSILVSVISICLFEKAAVLICIWTDSLQTRFSRGGRAKQHGPGPDKGQSSNAPAGEVEPVMRVLTTVQGERTETEETVVSGEAIAVVVTMTTMEETRWVTKKTEVIRDQRKDRSYSFQSLRAPSLTS